MNYRAPFRLSGTVLVAALILLNSSCGGQKSPTERAPAPSNPERALIMFYNVENLFDTINDPLTSDEEFLPGTNKDWNSKRYWKKITDLGEVISKADSLQLPDIVGLCEVENAAVLEDLVSSETLASGNFGIIHRNGPDARGIDVAAIYNKDNFKPKSMNFYTVTLKNSERPHTRQVLYIKGALFEEEIHCFVTHWPSRRGGAEESEHKRIQVAELIRSKVDSIQGTDDDAAIIIMGDFNDYPNNRSVHETLGATDHYSGNGLCNLLYSEHENGNGTYNYRGEWGVLDQFIVSVNIADPDRSVHTRVLFTKILNFDWLLYHDEKFDDIKPSRTYGGPNYYGGYSDHLPILLELEIH